MRKLLAVRPAGSMEAVRRRAGTGAKRATGAGALAGLFLSLGISFPGCSQAASQDSSQNQKGMVKMSHATGSFEVKVTPQPAGETTEGATLARHSLDKQFHGGLEATSKGEMLSAAGAVKGSGGYVAIEKVNGTLAGHKGTFVLQHSGTMKGGTYQLSIIVVPDSGTGELTGLTGKMNIIIADGKHSYDFEYTISAKP